MDKITNQLKEYHRKVFSKYGPTAQGVDWSDEDEVLVRYDKMLKVIEMDFYDGPKRPTILDVGCGWGGMAKRARDIGVPISIIGVDVVDEMIGHAKAEFPEFIFETSDVFAMEETEVYDFVVCNGILTQKHDFSIPEMERYSKRLIKKMFSLCRYGIAFNMMSTRVNFTVGNLYYQNPVELFTWLLNEVSPRVVLDHGYSSLSSGAGKFYDFTAYVYKK
jgi:2-polyprenyl-3-methyl-5-hydroxy-6-metoxy-1,4-benzoquinol methylase